MEETEGMVKDAGEKEEAEEAAGREAGREMEEKVLKGAVVGARVLEMAVT